MKSFCHFQIASALTLTSILQHVIVKGLGKELFPQYKDGIPKEAAYMIAGVVSSVIMGACLGVKHCVNNGRPSAADAVPHFNLYLTTLPLFLMGVVAIGSQATSTHDNDHFFFPRFNRSAVPGSVLANADKELVQHEASLWGKLVGSFVPMLLHLIISNRCLQPDPETLKGIEAELHAFMDNKWIRALVEWVGLFVLGGVGATSAVYARYFGEKGEFNQLGNVFFGIFSSLIFTIPTSVFLSTVSATKRLPAVITHVGNAVVMAMLMDILFENRRKEVWELGLAGVAGVSFFLLIARKLLEWFEAEPTSAARATEPDHSA